LCLFSAVLAGCATPAKAPVDRFEFTQPQMGVPFRMVLYATNEAHARLASDAAFARVRELNDRLSDYDLESELSKLSRSSGGGQPVKVSDDLWRVLATAQDWARKSDGALDVTVGPVVNLWRHARRLQQFPRADRLAEARSRVGYTNLVLDPKTKTALLRVPEMRLDLGGIAKGFAADEAMKVLRAHGIHSALVGAAGDIALGDAPPGQRGWKVEIPSLDVTNAPPGRFVTNANAGVSTAGDVFQRLELNGVRYSHIVDPRTGIGLTDHSLVTVIARNAMTSDALETVVSVLGPKKGLALIKKTPETSVRIMRKPGETIELIEYPSNAFSDGEKPGGAPRASSGDNPAAAGLSR
jgi:thiamine biosynthesis lipoprotein